MAATLITFLITMKLPHQFNPRQQHDHVDNELPHHDDGLTHNKDTSYHHDDDPTHHENEMHHHNNDNEQLFH